MSLKFRRNKAMKLFGISKQEKMTKDLALRQSNRRGWEKKKKKKQRLECGTKSRRMSYSGSQVKKVWNMKLEEVMNCVRCS